MKLLVIPKTKVKGSPPVHAYTGRHGVKEQLLKNHTVIGSKPDIATKVVFSYTPLPL